VIAVHQHLGLHDRDEAALLAQNSVAGQRVGVRLEAVLAWNARPDGNDRPPLGEARAERPVLREPLAESVEALGDQLAGCTGERLRALVHLDPGHDPLTRQQVRERRPVLGVLADGFVEKDHAADEAAELGRGE